jgi:hypothetical protein
MVRMTEVLFRIVLEQPPAGVAIGLQKGRGSLYETVQTQSSDGGDLIFEFTATVKDNGDFAGPFVQGKAGERFVYLDIGTLAGQAHSPWTRRLKVPLRDVPHAASVETSVAGTGRDGTPSCATPKDFSGWRARVPRPAKGK